jgi:hypothetical protein
MPCLSNLIRTQKIELTGEAFIVIKECSLVDNRLYETIIISMVSERIKILEAANLPKETKDEDLPPEILAKVKATYQAREAALSEHFAKVLPKVLYDHNFTKPNSDKKEKNEDVARVILESSTAGSLVMEEATRFFSQLVVEQLSSKVERKQNETAVEN